VDRRAVGPILCRRHSGAQNRRAPLAL
jgi:hypothetical protein